MRANGSRGRCVNGGTRGGGHASSRAACAGVVGAVPKSRRHGANPSLGCCGAGLGPVLVPLQPQFRRRRGDPECLQGWGRDMRSQGSPRLARLGLWIVLLCLDWNPNLGVSRLVPASLFPLQHPWGHTRHPGVYGGDHQVLATRSRSLHVLLPLLTASQPAGDAFPTRGHAAVPRPAESHTAPPAPPAPPKRLCLSPPAVSKH